MADNIQKNKSANAEREEKILQFWKEKGIFEKSLAKNEKAGKEFIFYEGPPTANGHPGIHHLEARAFKDAIPRYKTMQGYYVRRKGGWDTHGLPVELQVEKELGLKSKKEIESYGIEKFNDKCKESVWQYVHEWEQFTDRMGYWVDLKNPYITYKPYYIESVWNVIKTVAEEGLLYKDYKVVPWCPRCGTALSSHELAQGYEDVKDLAVTVKFEIRNSKSETNPKSQIQNPDEKGKTYLLAWTTTPWTLPGNVGLAVGEKIDYIEVEIKESGEHLILAKDRLSVLKEQQYSIAKTFKGKELLGLEYEPLYPFLAENVTGVEKEKLKNAYKVYAADFVTTTDGTGIVHTAVMYGQDDFELGTKVGLPKYHLVNEDGTFKKEVGFLAGRFVKDANTDVEIIKDLAHRQPVSLLFDKEKYEHSYPFCWRCHTPLIYFARDSWYVKMSDLRKKLVKENEGIHWEPEHIKEGRFGEWLREVKDWAISRERYWGTPLPIWNCEKCHKIKVVGSIEEVSRKPRNDYFVMRHGEAENNVQNILNNKEQNRFHLTELGKKQVTEAGEKFKKQLKGKKVDFIFVSPLLRTQETAKIMAEKLGIDAKSVITDDRLHEYGMGELDGKPLQELVEKFPDNTRFDKWPNGGESHADVKKRTGDVLYELEKKYEGKTILIITHENPACLLVAAAKGYDRTETNAMIGTRQGAFLNAELRKLDFIVLSHNREYELDLHKPYIDEVKLDCDCGGKMNRAKEVMDVWFDSGSMPFAEDHYPFENKKYIDKTGYPADFISEAIDQTRGWFYTLHAIGVLMGKGKAYKNVICLGHILDAEGKKMSKSIGNVVNPWDMMDKYGVDALRFWMYSVNQPGDSKNFEEKTVEEIVKKVFNMTLNVLAFYQLYSPSAKKSTSDSASTHVLDKWIISRLDQLIQTVTEGLDGYKFFEPTRAVKDFIADLSQWYLRRSRDRFKGEDQNDKNAALVTTRYVLLALGKVMAPFTPFFAEYLYGELGGEKESVHLEDWPKAGKSDEVLLENMENVRKISSLALEARMNAKINVRQPLRLLKIKAKQPKGFGPEFIDLVKDEVNVKEVVFDLSLGRDVEIDTTLTPELKEEGGLRELIRAIQDLRKEKGFTVNDRIILKVEADAKAKEFVEKFQNELAKATLLQDITFENDLQLAVMVVIGDLTMKIAI